MDETTRRIRDLLQRGEKIEAIKLLREATGMDLKQAAEEVDRLGAGQPPSAWVTTPAPGDDAVSDEVRRLAASGRKIEAIKHLRAETGLGLKEARKRVERITGGGGCAGVVVLLTGVLGALAAFLFGT